MAAAFTTVSYRDARAKTVAGCKAMIAENYTEQFKYAIRHMNYSGVHPTDIALPEAEWLALARGHMHLMFVDEGGTQYMNFAVPWGKMAVYRAT
jgi:hypothetical protein